MRKTGLNDIHPFICGSFNPSVHLEAFFESLLYTRYTRGVIDVERKVAAPALEFSLKKATGKRHSPFRVGSSMRLWENMGGGTFSRQDVQGDQPRENDMWAES